MTETQQPKEHSRELSTGTYLNRIGLSETAVGSADNDTLTRLQRAHVMSVPFETFSINGDPFSDRPAGGVSLSLPDLYDKIVGRRRGGFCFELNGLFGWLLAELGFEVTRLSARMVNAIELPANHHPLLVTLDTDYLVDVGMGSPMLREPLELGTAAEPDQAGVRWRVDESNRPDVDWVLRYREPDADWKDRYVFDTTPRSLDYFTATCEYLQTAPESGFTGSPVVTLAAPDGHKKLKPDQFTVTTGSDTTESVVTGETFHQLLREEFEISFPEDQAEPL